MSSESACITSEALSKASRVLHPVTVYDICRNGRMTPVPKRQRRHPLSCRRRNSNNTDGSCSELFRRSRYLYQVTSISRNPSESSPQDFFTSGPGSTRGMLSRLNLFVFFMQIGRHHNSCVFKSDSLRSVALHAQAS